MPPRARSRGARRAAPRARDEPRRRHPSRRRAWGRGFCLFNDVGVALECLRADGLVARALVVDCDVHQGDGTADLLGPDPDVFTLSLHGARNYPFQRIPSDLDVDLETGTGDDGYLTALDAALDHAIGRAQADVAFYLAGADPWEGDRLGRLALTKRGLLARDELVLDRLRATGAAVCVIGAGRRLRRRRARHGRHQRRDRGRRREAPKLDPRSRGVVLTGTHRLWQGRSWGFDSPRLHPSMAAARGSDGRGQRWRPKQIVAPAEASCVPARRPTPARQPRPRPGSR